MGALAVQKERGVAFRYGGVDVLSDADRLVSLTDMWKAAGCPSGKEPAAWKRRDDAASFIKDLACSLNVRQSHVLRSMRGKGGASWAHWQIAMAYAKYLSHEFHRFVNEAFREWAEEKANPDLKAARAVEGYRRRGWDDDRILARIEGIVQRKSFTDTLQAHGVSGDGYKFCTGVINREVLGASARELKIRRGLSPKAKTRDALEPHELAALRFAEALAEKSVKDSRARGNRACCDTCERTGKAIRRAIDSLSA